jgi:glutathione S-transferase
VVSRFITYGVAVPGFAASYMQALFGHEWMQQWIEAAEDEEWSIAQYESAPAG